MRALVVHDGAPDPVLRAALAAAGYDPIELATSVDEALVTVAERGAPDLGVLDVEDPLGACRRLVAPLRQVPLVAIAEGPAVGALFEAGADDCVGRPLREAELIARIHRARRSRGDDDQRARRERLLADEIRQLQRQKHDLECIACVDALTGIANRRHVLSRLHSEWKRAIREGTALALVMVDLDCFHAFNERYGHLGGDSCLRRVTDAMVVCLRRPSDVLGRYGGEEFLAVLGATDAAGARLVAERLRAAVEALAIPHDRSSAGPVVTISVGFAACQPSSDQQPDALLAATDAALLAAKAEGRNRIHGDGPPPADRPHASSDPWRRFAIVVADPWFADRIPQFLAAKPAEIAAFRAACEAGSFDSVRGLARRLRASALEHGFDPIAQYAGLLEQAANDEDRDAVAHVLDELAQYVEHVQVAYRRPHERKLDHAG